ncbi:MAG: N-acetylglucosamine-6-phosphate deacetylase [bacterium]|nr:N-acetylglucosamine-6-phosphate deacetylase [bacterium]
MWLLNGNVYIAGQGFCKKDLLLRNGIIEKIVPERCGMEARRCNGKADQEDAGVVDVQGAFVLPGLVDIHFHGCAGHDFCEGTREAFGAIEQYELRHGITAISPATMTLPEKRLSEICAAAAAYAKDSACLKGIYLEGPFLSEAKKGAQNSAYLRLPDADLLQELNRRAEGLIKIVAIAPELSGAPAVIGACAERFRFSAAHTTADYQTCAEAMRRGVRQVTHLYNAMPPFTHREPGVIGAAFDCGADVELIGDGVHVDACAVRMAFRLFGAEHVILISDSMMAAGMPDGMYELGGQAVRVRGKRAVILDGTIAGSVTNLYDCMVTVIRMGIPPEAAVRAATQNPAAALGIDAEYGSIEAGKKADLLVADTDWNLLKVYKHGREVMR